MIKASKVDEIFEEYGYFLGRAYEDDKGKLAVHNKGKIKQALHASLVELLKEDENSPEIYWGDGEKIIRERLDNYFNGGQV